MRGARAGGPVLEERQRRGFRLSTFTSLKHRDFRLIWSSTLFNSAGQWIQQVTLGWLVY
ncbi:MAG: MFS transporter, partial [Chloroflexi bacterium]|nr:MFS transporter [Chloroflexota bacterium]